MGSIDEQGPGSESTFTAGQPARKTPRHKVSSTNRDGDTNGAALVFSTPPSPPPPPSGLPYVFAKALSQCH
ncbi:hypothetical protein CesoFtcFv8_020561 [Champsocephalus esox]|uniref:Uncharacterized protein n=1 Tax=Champsocephalus esox TaxID=159716 RepID=A0AAN8BB13_9TELE|nr:hypothetical protein CesoFtcFv8_020561 [Champsocephalus esox]